MTEQPFPVADFRAVADLVVTDEVKRAIHQAADEIERLRAHRAVSGNAALASLLACLKKHRLIDDSQRPVVPQSPEAEPGKAGELIERLRSEAANWSATCGGLFDEAADEISRLRAALAILTTLTARSVEKDSGDNNRSGILTGDQSAEIAEPPPSRMEQRKAWFTYDAEAAKEIGEHLYYFAPDVVTPPPYREQRHVEAIIDVAEDGTLAGVELIYKMPPPLAANSAPGSPVARSPSSQEAVVPCATDAAARERR